MSVFDFLRRSSKPAAAAVAHKAHRDEPSVVSDGAALVARECARDTVRQLTVLEKLDLDFTPVSLSAVEQILDRCSARGMRSPTQNGLVLGLGCYLGEVIRKDTRAQWVFHKDTPLASVPHYPPNFLHLMLPDPQGDQFVNVFNKIAARLDGDGGASLAAYCRAIAYGALNLTSASEPKQA